MKLDNIINNENQTEKFGRRNNGLCYINIPIGSINFDSDANIINSNLIDIRNLFNIQFSRKLDSYSNFKFKDALIFIEKQKKISNKIIIIPLEIKEDDYWKLHNKFIELYPNDTYTLVIIGLELQENIEEILTINLNNRHINSVSLIEHYSKPIVHKLGLIINKFKTYYTIGVVNLQRYQGEQYFNFSSIIYYWYCGAKFCSFRDFRLDGGGGGRGKKSKYYKFNEETFLNELLTDEEINELKKEIGSKNLDQLLKNQNLDRIYSSIESNKKLNFEEIRELIQIRSGKKIF